MTNKSLFLKVNFQKALKSLYHSGVMQWMWQKTKVKRIFSKILNHPEKIFSCYLFRCLLWLVFSALMLILCGHYDLYPDSVWYIILSCVFVCLCGIGKRCLVERSHRSRKWSLPPEGGNISGFKHFQTFLWHTCLSH